MASRTLLISLLTLVVWPTAAQQFRSTISGRVMDPQGASVPSVTVLVTNKATGARNETVSSATGQYVLPLLEPGVYQLEAQVSGFKKYILERLELRANEPIAVDIELQLGQTTESVTVEAVAPLLSTTTASSGQVIGTAMIDRMPMNGRTPLALAQLAFGVVPTRDPAFLRPFDNNGPSAFSMGGAPQYSNEILLDGAPNTTNDKRIAYNSPVDMVSEVKVEVFQADAAYGNTGGGTVNIVQKSGTNSFHGNAYDFNQVSALAATPYFTNAAGRNKTNLVFNQWGVNAGGPVMIPKLFDGRNKLLWIFAYEGVKDRIPEPLITTVPTEAQRRGDFSSLLALGSQYTVYDPLTGVREGTRIRREAFPNNVIPSNRLNGNARSYLQYYPQPNQPGRADGKDNYLAATSRGDDFWSAIGRLDVNISDRHKLFGSFRHNIRTEFRGNLFDNLATGNRQRRVNWGTTIDDVYTFTPTTVLNTRANWTRWTQGNINNSFGFDMTSLGFPASLATASSQAVMPVVAFQDFQTLGHGADEPRPYDHFQIFASLTKIVGVHALKFGTDMRLYRENGANYGDASGRYTFNDVWTRGPLDNSARSPLGQDFAAFLLGLPSAGQFDVGSFYSTQSKYAAFFFQDDWNVTPTLSLNLGVRYEKDFPLTERYNRMVVGFDPTLKLAVTDAARANYTASPLPVLSAAEFNPTGGLVYATPSQREAYSTSSNAFSPRVGFAWTPAALGRKTVFRGGGGIFYFTSGHLPPDQPGYFQRTPLVATLDNYLTPAMSLSNPFPGGVRPPDGNANGGNTFVGQSVTTINERLRNPYSIRWSFSLQRQLTASTMVEAGYIGNHAVRLTEDRPLNFIRRDALSTNQVRDQAVIDRLTANVANPFRNLVPGTPLNGGTTTVGQLLRPYPQFSGDNGWQMRRDNFGSSVFHMLQVRLDRRFAVGAQMMLNYQFSKLLEKRSFLNPSDLEPERRPALEDRPHRFVASGFYELPFGRGKALGKDSGRAVDAIIGGWTLNGIYTYTTGAPVTWGNVLYLGGDLKWDAGNPDTVFDRTRFITDPRQQLDFNIRTFPSRFSSYRESSLSTVDFSLLKDFRIFEGLKLQYRAEAFNAFNTPTFQTYNLTPTSTSFGRATAQRNLPRVIQMALKLSW